MANGKSFKLWIVNVVSFILFILLSITGLINWLILPRGFEARGSFLGSLRHFLRGIHEWAALAFIIIVAVHFVLHGSYIKNNLKKYGLIK